MLNKTLAVTMTKSKAMKMMIKKMKIVLKITKHSREVVVNGAQSNIVSAQTRMIIITMELLEQLMTMRVTMEMMISILHLRKKDNMMI
jgi:hypothetical protein